MDGFSITNLVAAMLSWLPPGVNSIDIDRFNQIAQDAYVVSADSPVFQGDDAKEKTALLLLSIASLESGGYREDVDTGKVRGDHGEAVCLGQVHVPRAQREYVARNRKACFRAMISAIKVSFAACHALNLTNRLSGYTIGKCRPSETSRARMSRALSWPSTYPHGLYPEQLADAQENL